MKRPFTDEEVKVMPTGTVPVHTPCWTELGSTDPEASRAFYSALFGWSAHTDPRPEAGGYTVMRLGDAPVAAVSPQYAPGQPTAWTVSLKVKDADATAASVEIAGGKALMPPMDVFDSGRFAVFTDPGGAVFTVWQPREFDGTRVLGEPSTLGWVELSTRDAKQAGEFYRHVFSWTAHPSGFCAGFATEWSVGQGPAFGGMTDLNLAGPDAVGTPSHWTPYFVVRDVDASAAAAVAAGANILTPPDDAPDGGHRTCVLQDPQGAVFGVYRGAPQD